MIVKPLSWDSAFFNLKIGELQSEVDAATGNIQGDFDLVYVKSSKEFELNLLNYSAKYSEVKVVFEKKGITAHANSSTTISDVFHTEYNLDDLYQLAFESGRYSRFAMDPLFTEINFRKLYRTWIDNSLNKTFADGFLVDYVKKEIRGFVTYQIKDTKAVIGLIATSPKYYWRDPV